MSVRHLISRLDPQRIAPTMWTPGRIIPLAGGHCVRQKRVTGCQCYVCDYVVHRSNVLDSSCSRPTLLLTTPKGRFTHDCSTLFHATAPYSD